MKACRILTGLRALAVLADVAGCLAERKQDELLQELPGVDRIVGVFGREEIADVVAQARLAPVRKNGVGHAAEEQRSLFRPAPVRAQEDTARLRITPRHYAYPKISEGCNHRCTSALFHRAW